MDFVIFIVFIMAIALAAFWWIDKNEREKQEKRQASALKIEPNFNAAIKYLGRPGYAGLAIDPETHKFAILLGDFGIKVFSFENLVQVEILQNGSSIQKTNRGSQLAGAAIGSLVFGPLGFIVGGLTGSKRTIEKIRKLSLKIYTDDLVTPVYEILFFAGDAAPDSIIVRSAANELDAWHGRFQTILAKAQKASPSTPLIAN